MPKASCQIDKQGGRTVRSFLATVAARHAAFEVGAPHPAPLATLVVPAMTKAMAKPSLPDMPCWLDPSAQLKPQFFHRHKGEK
jgi:hypothetical protein